MEHDYWFKQGSEPLFPDTAWSKPETKHQAGKLLIVGGNSHAIATTAGAYAQAMKAGIGTIRVLLPDSTKKTVGPLVDDAFFASSGPSGGFAKQALAEFIEHVNWSDGVLLAGDFGHNSETAILIEEFIKNAPHS